MPQAPNNTKNHFGHKYYYDQRRVKSKMYYEKEENAVLSRLCQYQLPLFIQRKRGIATTSIVSILITLYIGVFNPIALFMYRLEEQKVHGKTVNGNINEVATSIPSC